MTTNLMELTSEQRKQLIADARKAEKAHAEAEATRRGGLIQKGLTQVLKADPMQATPSGWVGVRLPAVTQVDGVNVHVTLIITDTDNSVDKKAKA